MRHLRKRGQLGVRTKHRRALLRNLTRSLVIHKKIKTTHAKAKQASAFADKMIQIAKRGDLHARRLLISRLGCAKTANTLIVEIAPHFKNRAGGYTRVLHLGPRQNDASEMALLEFTELIAVDRPGKKSKKKKKPSTAPTQEKKDDSKKKPKAKTSTSEVKASTDDADKAKDDEKKESEKRGGFLGSLRKFLKGE